MGIFKGEYSSKTIISVQARCQYEKVHYFIGCDGPNGDRGCGWIGDLNDVNRIVKLYERECNPTSLNVRIHSLEDPDNSEKPFWRDLKKNEKEAK